jgi:hypothetical protein
LRAEGFFSNLDILYGGLGIGKLQFLVKKKYNFFQFLVIKALDPDWIRVRIGVHPKMLDPDPDLEKMNTDPQPCRKLALSRWLFTCPDTGSWAVSSLVTTCPVSVSITQQAAVLYPTTA